MKFANFFTDRNNRDALERFSKTERRAMGKACNDHDYIMRMKRSLAGSTKRALEGVSVCTFSVTYHGYLLREGVVPLLGKSVSAFFTVINGVPWVLINTDEPLQEVALVHESVHYEQWKRGDFVPIEGGVIWKGQMFRNEAIDQVVAEKGLESIWMYLPWEKEAYAKQFNDEQVNYIRQNAEPQQVENLEKLLAMVGRVVPQPEPVEEEELNEGVDGFPPAKPEPRKGNATISPVAQAVAMGV